jgi:hypothetical protein
MNATSATAASARPAPPPPPTKHQLALMIWLAVFPTLTVLTSRSAAGSGNCRRCCGPSSWPRSPSPSSSTASCRSSTGYG